MKKQKHEVKSDPETWEDIALYVCTNLGLPVTEFWKLTYTNYILNLFLIEENKVTKVKDRIEFVVIYQMLNATNNKGKAIYNANDVLQMMLNGSIKNNQTDAYEELKKKAGLA